MKTNVLLEVILIRLKLCRVDLGQIVQLLKSFTVQGACRSPARIMHGIDATHLVFGSTTSQFVKRFICKFQYSTEEDPRLKQRTQ